MECRYVSASESKVAIDATSWELHKLILFLTDLKAYAMDDYPEEQNAQINEMIIFLKGALKKAASVHEKEMNYIRTNLENYDV